MTVCMYEEIIIRLAVKFKNDSYFSYAQWMADGELNRLTARNHAPNELKPCFFKYTILNMMY